MRTVWEAVRPLVAVTILFAVASWWAVKSPNGLVYQDARWFYVMCGTIFSNICVSLPLSFFPTGVPSTFLAYWCVLCVAVSFNCGPNEFAKVRTVELATFAPVRVRRYINVGTGRLVGHRTSLTLLANFTFNCCPYSLWRLCGKLANRKLKCSLA